MKIKIPQTVKIGGHVYSVIPDYTFTERTDLLGDSCHTSARIRISKLNAYGEELAEREKEQTLIHEILHAIDKVYNDSKLDEGTVSRISEGIFQVLVDNDLVEP